MPLLPVTSVAFFENAAGRLVPDLLGFLRLTWQAGPTSSADRRVLLEQMLRWLKQNGTGKVLADQRLMTPFSPADQEWINTDWTPRAVQDGNYRFRAILIAENVFARLATAAVMMPRRDEIAYQLFDEEEAAIKWLLAQ